MVKGLTLERKPRGGDDVDVEEGWPLGKIDGKEMMNRLGGVARGT